MRCAINFFKVSIIVPTEDGWNDVAFNELLFHLGIAAIFFIFILFS